MKQKEIRKVLVVNSGSSSLKYQLFDMKSETRLAKGLVERIGVSVDKDSGIVNDFNKFAEEKGEPRYCLDLILRVITVSLETLKIVRSLPHIDFALCK